jgi:hypothetical protein
MPVHNHVMCNCFLYALIILSVVVPQSFQSTVPSFTLYPLQTKSLLSMPQCLKHAGVRRHSVSFALKTHMCSISKPVRRLFGSRRLYIGWRVLADKVGRVFHRNKLALGDSGAQINALLTVPIDSNAKPVKPPGERDIELVSSNLSTSKHPSVDTAAFLAAAEMSSAPIAWFRCKSHHCTPELFPAPGGHDLAEYMSLPPSQYVDLGGVERKDDTTFCASLPPISFAPGLSVQPVCLLEARQPALPYENNLGVGCDISTIAAEVRGSPAIEALNGAFVCSFVMRIRHLPPMADKSIESVGRIGAECDLSVGVQGACSPSIPPSSAVHACHRIQPVHRIIPDCCMSVLGLII